MRRGLGRKIRYRVNESKKIKCRKNNHRDNLIYVSGKYYCTLCNINLPYDVDSQFKSSKQSSKSHLENLVQ